MPFCANGHYIVGEFCRLCGAPAVDEKALRRALGAPLALVEPPDDTPSDPTPLEVAELMKASAGSSLPPAKPKSMRLTRIEEVVAAFGIFLMTGVGLWALAARPQTPAPSEPQKVSSALAASCTAAGYSMPASAKVSLSASPKVLTSSSAAPAVSASPARTAGVVTRFHDPLVCTLTDTSKLPENWTHGDYVAAVAAEGGDVEAAARSDCGQPMTAIHPSPSPRKSTPPGKSGQPHGKSGAK